MWVVLLVASVFLCVVLHEFGHSLQARRYGIKVRDIVLLPIGGMARAERIPDVPRQEIIIAIAGPLVNFGLVLIFFVAIWLRRAPLSLESDFLLELIKINLILGTFNLIPAFPMDGGRILRGVLATRMPYVKATRYAKNVGQIIAIIFVVVGFLNTQFIMLPLIAVFVFFGAIGEERSVRARVALESRTARDFVAADDPVLFIDDRVESIASRVGESGAIAFPITDREGALAGAVDVRAVAAAIEAGRLDEPLAHFVAAGFPLFDASTPALHVYHLLHSKRTPLAGVIDGDQFIGLIFLDDLARSIT